MIPDLTAIVLNHWGSGVKATKFINVSTSNGALTSMDSGGKTNTDLGHVSKLAGKRGFMDEKVKQHLINYCNKEEYGTTDEDLKEVLVECSKNLHREEFDRHRWWTLYKYVVEIDGMIIGYIDAETTGDDSPYDKGYEDGAYDVKEMKAVPKTITVYEPV